MPTVAEDWPRHLLRWYRRTARKLPWREKKPDPYAVWISEIMLQQTRVDSVVAYFTRFIARFPSVTALAAADEESVLKLWEGLGYYSRARNLHRAAMVIVRDLDGVFPASSTTWQQLPGIGPYTAAAIASIAFGERVPVVDGNVLRVHARLFDSATDISRPATRKQVAKDLAAYLPARNPGDFNQAMMELGACCCVPRNPACQDCPIRFACLALQRGRTAELPVKRKRPAIPLRRVATALIIHQGKVLALRRSSTGMLGGLWGFPEVELTEGADPAAILSRTLAERFGIPFQVVGHLGRVRHAYTHFRIEIEVFHCLAQQAEESPFIELTRDLCFLTPSQLDALPLSTADRHIRALLPAEFCG